MQTEIGDLPVKTIELSSPRGTYHLAFRQTAPIDRAAFVFLHGFPTSARDWQRITPAFADRACVFPDLLGFGASAKPAIRYTYELQADLMEALFAHLGIRSVSLIAHDYAVTVAQELLLREQNRTLSFSIERVIFLNGAVYAALHRPQRVQRALLLPVIGAALARRMTAQRLLSGLRKIAGTPEAWTEADAALHFADIASHGGLARLPALLHYIADRKRQGAAWARAMENAADKIGFVWGEADPVSGAHVLSEVRAHMPGVRTISVPGAGHYPHWEQPEQTAAAVRALLQK